MVFGRRSVASAAATFAIKIRADRGADAYFGLDGLEAQAASLVEVLEGLGFRITRSHNWLRLCFNPKGAAGHRDGDREQMDQLLLSFKKFLDSTAQLPSLETTPVSPDTVS